MSVCDEYYEWKWNAINLRKNYNLSCSNDNYLSQQDSCNTYNEISDACCFDHGVNKQYASPMPWIGIYVAAASLVCSLTMAANVFHGFSHRKLWFPCRFFTLNAAYLTLLGVAMKLPVDLSAGMPTPVDQLAKLTSTTFMCTVIGNFMPSLGAMDDAEIFMNIIALAILLITISVNICIQLITGVIDIFIMVEYIVALSFMLVLLLVSCFSALTVSTTKKCLQLNYDNKHKIISSEESEETKKFTIEKLKVDVKKYWMMAKTGSPQFVVARSVTCYASGTICFLAALTLVKVHIRVLFLHGGSFYTYDPKYVGSDYKWSTFVILVIQSFGVVVGTIAPAIRCFTTIRLRRSEKRAKSYKTVLKTENYWIKRLVGWKERPLALQVQSQICKKFVHNTKNLILDFCKGVQIVIVSASKLNLLISFVLIIPFLSLGSLYKFISKHIASSNPKRSESGPTELDLSRYVLFLEGEEELPLQIMKNNWDATDHFIQKGEKRRPKFLKELLDKSTSFMGVARFDSDKVSSVYFVEFPNCWSLAVVTLTSIAIALPNIKDDKVKWLIRSVSEGLVYAKLVEKFLNVRSDMVNIRNAADSVWLGVDVFRMWLNEDLRKIAREGINSAETLKKLADIAKNMNGDPKEDPLNWPINLIAANSMYRISQTVLQDHEDWTHQTDETAMTSILLQAHEGSNETLFEQLSIMIADILCACLTNLPRVINMKFFCCGVEKRENSVLHAAQLIGEMEEILKILQERKLPSLDTADKLAYIDEWRDYVKANPVAFTSLNNDGTSSSGSAVLVKCRRLA